MRIPVLSSILDGGRNIGSALNSGWDLPRNIGQAAGGDFSGFGRGASHLGSVGGLLTAGGAIGAGALAGGIIGANGEVESTMQGVAIGAAAGALALPAIGLAAKGAYSLGSSAVKGIVNKAVNPISTAGASSAASMMGTAAMTAAVPAARMAKGIIGMGSKLVNFNAEADMFSKVKFTGLGKSLIAGSALIKGAAGGFNELNKSHMGTMDGQITRATPRMQPSQPAYAQNAGATGDLVFAMNKNRRG
jgi:hypothetical protein